MVQEEVLNRIDAKSLTVHVVWAPVLEDDDRDAAVEAQSLIPDKRAVHYWDGELALGIVYGRIVELPSGRDLAWDIYFAYPDGTRWDDRPPVPSDFSHQLGYDKRHLRDGVRLRRMVERLLDAAD